MFSATSPVVITKNQYLFTAYAITQIKINVPATDISGRGRLSNGRETCVIRAITAHASIANPILRACFFKSSDILAEVLKAMKLTNNM